MSDGQRRFVTRAGQPPTLDWHRNRAVIRPSRPRGAWLRRLGRLLARLWW